VLGLSISLAALSHVRWAAKQSGVRLRNALGWDSFLGPFFGGLVMFAIGMAWGATQLWERLAWVVLGLLFAWQVLLAIRGLRRASAVEEEGRETTQ
jgi:hypothetical protein